MTSRHFGAPMCASQTSRNFLRQIMTALCSTALAGSAFLLPLMPAYATPDKQEQRVLPQDEYRQMGRGDWLRQPFDAPLLPTNSADTIALQHFAAGRLKEAVEALENECKAIAKNWKSVADKELYEGSYYLPIRALVHEKHPCLQRLTGTLVAGENSVPVYPGESTAVVPPSVAAAGRGTRGSAVDSRFRWYDDDKNGANRSGLAYTKGFGDSGSVPAGKDVASYALQLASLLSRLAEVELASGQPDDLDLTNRHLLASRAWLARAAGLTVPLPPKSSSQESSEKAGSGLFPGPHTVTATPILTPKNKELEKPYKPTHCSEPEDFLQDKVNGDSRDKVNIDRSIAARAGGKFGENIRLLVARNKYTHALLYLTSTDWGNAIDILAKLSKPEKIDEQNTQIKLISIMANISLARARMLVGEQPNLVVRDLCLYTDKADTSSKSDKAKTPEHGSAATALKSAATGLASLRSSPVASASPGEWRQIEMLHLSLIATSLSWAEMMVQPLPYNKNEITPVVENMFDMFKEQKPQLDELRKIEVHNIKSAEDLRRESLIHGYKAHQEFIKVRLGSGNLAAATKDLNIARESAEKLGDLFLQARWNWLYGRIQRQAGRHTEAQAVLERAVSQLDALRADLLRAGTGPGESFRETLAPVYRELVAVFMDKLLPKNGPQEQDVDQPSVLDKEKPNQRSLPDLISCARLKDAAVAEKIGCAQNEKKQLLGNIFYYMEKLKAAELEDYFKDDCVARVRNNENRIDDIIFHEFDDDKNKDTNPAYDDNKNKGMNPAYLVYPVFLPDRIVTIVTHYIKDGLRHTLITVPSTPYELENLIRKQNFILSRSIGDKTRRRGGRGGELFPTVPGMMNWRSSDALPEFHIDAITPTTASPSRRSTAASPLSNTDTAQDPVNSTYNVRITDRDAQDYFKNNEYIYKNFIVPIFEKVVKSAKDPTPESVPTLIFAPDGILYTLLLPGLGETKLPDTRVPAIEELYKKGSDTLIRRAALAIIPGRTLAYFDKSERPKNGGAGDTPKRSLRVLTAAQRLFNVIGSDPTLHAKSRTELRANVADACMMTCAPLTKESAVEFKDGEFCPASFMDTLARQDFDIIHIGAHARIAASSSRNLIETDLPPPARYRSELTKGWDARVAARHHVRWSDGNLTLGDLGSALQGLRMRPTPLQMLVLSACDTAAGDARAALGLAGMAVQAGARSALGTLLSVNDDITYGVMHQFYKNLLWPSQDCQPVKGQDGPLPMSRTMALRDAQITCIGNKSCFGDEKIAKNKCLSDGDQTLLKKLHKKIFDLTEQSRKFSGSTDKSYKVLLDDLTDWAPFVLIGDWRPIPNVDPKRPQSTAPISSLDPDATSGPVTPAGQRDCLKQCLEDYNDVMTSPNNSDRERLRRPLIYKSDFDFCQVPGGNIMWKDAEAIEKYMRAKRQTQ